VPEASVRHAVSTVLVPYALGSVRRDVPEA
jgi:hypothetical protein